MRSESLPRTTNVKRSKKFIHGFAFAIFLLLTLESFNQLSAAVITSVASGNWNATTTWSSGTVPTATDDVIIANGHTVTINATGLVARTLVVNGSLTYAPTPAGALTVNGDVTVSAGGSFTSPASGTVVTHALNIGGSTATGVGGNLVVDGVFNMNAFSTAGVVVTFWGTSSNTISGSGTINFYAVSVNKGTANTSILDVTSVITCPDATSTVPSRLSVTAGTFKLSSASTLSPWYGTTQVTSPNIARLWLNNAGATLKSVGSGTAGGSNGTLSFGGLLQIDAGTLSHGNGASSISIFGNFTMGGASATLNVYGSFMSGSASIYTITAGNINIYPQVGPNYAPATYFSQGGLFQFGGNTINFTGGTLNIVDPTLAVNSGFYYAPYSVLITGTNLNLTGSTIRFGDGTSDLDGGTNGFSISSAAVLGNVIVNNAPASTRTNRTVKLLGNVTIGGNLTINPGTANQFLVNGFMLTTKGNITNSGTFNFDVAAPGNGTSGLTFTGTAPQTVSGTGTFSANVNNLIINNTSGASPAVDLQIPLSVSNGLTLTNGVLGSTNSSALTIGKTGYTTFNLTRSGGSLASVPSFVLGGVTAFNVTYTAPSPAAAITTGYELPASQQVTTLTVSNSSGVTLDKPVSCTTLSLTSGVLTTSSTNTVTVTGPAVTNITGGSASSYVNGPLTRTIPNNAASANYKFPVGKTAYQLFEYSSITTAGTGTATFTAEAFDAGPYAGTAGTGLSSVNTDKYWSLTGSLGSITISSSAIRLTDAGLASTNKIGQSNSAPGTYNSIGGSIGTGTITSSNPVDYSAFGSGTFFRIGQASAFAAGTYAIGPQASYTGYTGTFASITSAVAAITAVPLPGNVIFEFQNDYDPAVEPATISMTSSIASSAAATVTFRPAPGVSSIINISRAGTVLTNAGADYIIFDGRNGGTGTNKFLQFTNTTSAGSAVTLSADARNNQFLYCIFKGSTTTASTGILTVNAPASGNNFLTVDNCNFDGSGLANNCLYTTGAASDATITNNNFYDYRNGAGIYLASGSNNGVIDANSFYQTTAYNGFAGTTYGIYVGSGTNVTISNNYIGGNGPALRGTWTVSATTPAAYNFTGINAASLGATGKIFNNKIQNFDWKSTPATWTGINASGTVNIGVDGGNFIGSSTGNDNIKITYYNTNGAATVNGIVIGGGVTVSNNNIGSITTLLSGATGIGSSINGILNNATSAVISNNVIGSATTAQSINAANQTTTGNAQNIIGINCLTVGSVNITGNTIANLYNGMTFASASAGMIRGIRIPNTGSAITISSNNFFSYSTPQPMTGAVSFGSSAHSVVAIDLNATNVANTAVTGNTIYDLSNTSPTGAVSVLGIYCQSGSNSVFEKNYIHSLSTVSPNATLTGINLNYGGPCTMRNNVIRLGFDNAGNPITSNAQINGIIKNSGSGFPCYAYFNTVYVGGDGVTAGPAATYCFNVTMHVTEDIRDNLFVNTRSGGGTNYAIKAMGTGTAPSGLTLNYNDYYVSGTGSMLGYYNGNVADLTAWKAAVGLDANSVSLDPQFASVTSNNPLNAALAAGTSITGISTDFAGLTRNASTPTIGAYELNFGPLGNNNVNFVHGVTGTVCATADPDGTAVLTAPAGTVFDRVIFASYGNPTGTCPDFVIGSCNATSTLSIVEGYLLGKNSASIAASNNIFGDPCPGTFKSLYISASYSVPVCPGTLPGTVTGSAPTGGTGSYTYLWESSTTSSTSGFSAAPGTNNTQDYTPGALSQTTWFRRTVTSGSFSDTSPAVMIFITPSQPVSVTIASSATAVDEGASVTLTATPVNGGTLPSYQWKVNNVNAGTDNPVFNYVPVNGDVVTCVLTSNAVCASGSPATSNPVTITVNSQITGNTLSFTAPLQGTACATASPDMFAVLNAPAGTVFVSVDFASYGNPAGTCPNFTAGSCNAASTKAIVEGLLLGNNSASIQASNNLFGDPCPGTFKSLYISATYAAPVCSGSLPGTITGSLPTGGSGGYTYLWEISTTDAVNGFTPAPGTNTGQDYTPGALSQTTWFRRTVTSGVLSNTSAALVINVTTGLPVSVSIAASSANVEGGTPVTFTATPTNGGVSPAYQWKVNNTNAGTNSSQFTYVPANGDVVTCELTSSELCASGNPAISNSVTMNVSAPISNNVVDYVNGVSGTVCATASSDLFATLTAPAGTVFVKVNFASYGNPTGSCPDFVMGSCNAATSQSIVEGYLLGNSSATIQASNNVFGDPCPGTFKSLYVLATYAEPVCSGTQPGIITGSTTAGGNGIYTYLWEVSTTGGTSGFSPAPGTNDAKDYTPGPLSQTTWFRRTVTSGSFSNTSAAVAINVTPAQPVSVSIVASATEVTEGTPVTFTATPVNGGAAPVYQWKVNNVNAGTNSPLFTYVPANNDVVTCELTSSMVCASGNPATSAGITMTVSTQILNNTIDFTNGVSGTVCATAFPDMNADLAAPAGTVFVKVGFASYGNPSGSCPDFVIGLCHAANSQLIAEGYLLGVNAASIPATNTVFGDPCPGTFKNLYVSASYAEPVCSGSTPGAITGSIPTGGNGTFTYLWESSTAGPASGFSAAAGTSNTKDYAPGALTQTTWFRRTITSGGFSSVSSVIQVTVVNCGVAGLMAPRSLAAPFMAGSTNTTVNAMAGSNEQSVKAEALPERLTIDIYPVPNNGTFTVAMTSKEDDKLDIAVMNTQGSVLMEKRNVFISNRTEIAFDMTDSPAGVYYLRFTNVRTHVVKKIIIKK